MRYFNYSYDDGPTSNAEALDDMGQMHCLRCNRIHNQGTLCSCVEEGDSVLTKVVETWPKAAKDYPGIPKGTQYMYQVAMGYEVGGPRWMETRRFTAKAAMQPANCLPEEHLLPMLRPGDE